MLAILALSCTKKNVLAKTACDIGAYETGGPQMTVSSPMSGILNFGTVTGLTSRMVTVMNTGNATVPAPQTGAISGAQASAQSALIR